MLEDRQAASASAVAVYRITLPLSYLEKAGHTIRWLPKDELVWRLAQGQSSLLEQDIIVLSRLIAKPEDSAQAAEVMALLRSRGAKLVYECDDDYTGQYRYFEGMTCHPFCRHADAVTVSTPHLGKLMAEASGRPVFVLPNCIERAWFSQQSLQTPRQDERLTVGLAGTPTHFEDWKIMAEVVPVLRARYPEVRWLAAGFLPSYLENLVEYVPPVSYQGYPGVLRQVDILCAPLCPEDRFNHSKSYIKAIEGWCAARPVGHRIGGCAVVVSGAVPYMGTVNNRHNGLVVAHNAAAWIEALDLLIRTPVLRQNLQVEGHKDSAEYDIAKHWRRWERAYVKIKEGRYDSISC